VERISTAFFAGKCIPPAPVDAPPPGVPSQYGLFSAARIIEDPPDHELNGVEYEPVCNVRVDEWPMNCTPYRGADARPGRDEPKPDVHVRDCARDLDPMPYPKGRDEGPAWPYGRKLFSHSTGVTTALPFGVYAGEDCFLGNSDQEQALADLRERFTLGEQTTVERVIYDGLLGVVPALRYKPQILTAEGRPKDQELVSPVEGVGLLEHWLACSSGATGVIHVPRFMAAMFGNAQTLHTKGQRALSTLEHTYVFGAGYSGAGPYGDTKAAPEKPDKVWLYASRPVTIRRSPLIQPADYQRGAFSKARNEASLLYERVYVVDWACEVAAIQVDYPRFRLDTRPVEEPEQEQ
jgi:hypothetical protein